MPGADLDDPAEPESESSSDPAIEPLGIGLDPDIALPLIVAASAILAALGGFRPTGNAAADFVLSAGFGAVVPWLAKRVDGRSLLIAGSASVVFSGFQLPSIALAAAAVVLVLAPALIRPFDAPTLLLARTASAALIVHAALRFPNIRWVGTASTLAAVALAPIVYAAWKTAASEERATVRRVGVWLGAVVVVATALTGVAALLARGTVEDGITLAEDGIDAIERGDQDGAAELLRAAGEDFQSASNLLGGPLTWPARLVPIVAQHTRALETASREGQDLAAAAVQTVTTADVDQIRGSNGSIDLDLVRDVNAELTNASRVLVDAQAAIRSVRTPWLLPLLDDRLASVEVELLDVLADIDLATQATAVMPGILGGDGPRTYLVLFVQPAESREYGGFVGAYGLLRAEGGDLALMESGSIDDGFISGVAEFVNPERFPQHYRDKQPDVFPQNLTSIADLTTIALAARELAPQWRDDPDFVLDGVLTIDPFALAGFLELTGPVPLVGRAEPIDSSNVADYLIRDQYLEFADEYRDTRQDALRDLAATAFAELLSIEIPGPERLGAIFGPLARSDRLAFTTFDEDENAFFRRILLDADLPIVGDKVQMLGIYGATAVAGKLDAYSTRNVSYDVTIDPATGEAVGLLDVELINDAPPDAPLYVLRNFEQDDFGDDLLEVGSNLMVLNLYTRAEIDDLTSADAEFTVGDRNPALDYDHQMIGVEVPIQTVRHASARFTEQLTPGRYDLLITAQPTALLSTLTLTIRPTEGWRIVGVDDPNPDGSWTITEALDVHRPYSVLFEPSE